MSHFNHLYIGATTGTVSKVSRDRLLIEEEVQLDKGAVQCLTHSDDKLYALTEQGTLHQVSGNNESLLEMKKIMASWPKKIKQVVFPSNFSQLFACLADQRVIIYRAGDCKELL